MGKQIQTLVETPPLQELNNPSILLFTLVLIISDTTREKIIHIACILMSSSLANYFPSAVNRNEAVFLQAWLTTHREACLSDVH